jgi:hypothetical protein
MVALFNVIDAASHTSLAPVIGAGRGNTVTINDELHPVDNIYEMVVVPTEPLVTTPVDGCMLATPAFVLLHVPPATALLSVVVSPIHTLDAPVIGSSGLTDTTFVATHPVDKE